MTRKRTNMGLLDEILGESDFVLLGDFLVVDLTSIGTEARDAVLDALPTVKTFSDHYCTKCGMAMTPVGPDYIVCRNPECKGNPPEAKNPWTD